MAAAAAASAAGSSGAASGLSSAATAAAISSGAQVTGTLASGWANAHYSRKNMRHQAKIQREQAEWDRANAPTQNLQGMQRAGINPFADSSSEFSGTMPAASSAGGNVMGDLGQAVDTGTGVFNAVMSGYRQKALLDHEVNLMEAKTAAEWVNSEVGRESIAKLKADTNLSWKEAEKLSVDMQKTQVDIDKTTADIKAVYAEIIQTQAATRQTESQISLNEVALQQARYTLKHMLPAQLKEINANIDVQRTVAALNQAGLAKTIQDVALGRLTLAEATKLFDKRLELADAELSSELYAALNKQYRGYVVHGNNQNATVKKLRDISIFLGTIIDDVGSGIFSTLLGKKK